MILDMILRNKQQSMQGILSALALKSGGDITGSPKQSTSVPIMFSNFFAEGFSILFKCNMCNIQSLIFIH